MDKREFLFAAGSAMSAAVTGSWFGARPRAVAPRDAAPSQGPAPGDFWAELRARYRLPEGYVDLEHGYYSRMSEDVLDAFVGHARDVNRDAAFYMRRKQPQDKLEVRSTLATTIAGVSPDELILTRNTTESLDTVIAGFPWQRGDEAVFAEQDYHAMQSMFRQVSRRHGVVTKVVSVPIDPQSDDEVVEVYRRAITERTRLLMVCHMINLTGHVLPIRKIADMAHERSVQVMVDGAHAFAHLDFEIPDLGCDYYGASLHKWLGAPLGCGMLYVSKQRVEPLWPLFGDHHAVDSIDKLNHTGTHPAHTDLAIHAAITQHRTIGAARKEQRLRALQRHWTDQVRDAKGIVLNTPRDPQRSCAIANVGVEGVTPVQLEKRLFDEFHIHTVAIDGVGVRGVRVTPQCYTTTDELDRLVAALKAIAAG
ncbi:MAG: aminotransferase class V-fold PLP-dependent enzyme [Planctomycetes bacterium]|nr:aminotransferase class V-fold PLP-dependent enzyme [Planctomycetota bacterium]